MSGAVIVPDLSANQAAVKTFKKFIAVNGFTKSVLQCDGHSGLLAFQEQVGQEMSLPTQISPPYSHQSQGTIERFHKTLYGQVRAIRIGLADHLNVDADHLDAAFTPWIIQHAAFQINRFLVRSDGKTSFEKIFKKPQRSPIVHFGERVLAHIQSQPPAQKLQIRASPQKSFGLWLGKDVFTGMHIVTLMDGQILRTRTVTRLTREDQFKLDEFKKFKIAVHESSFVHEEDSYDQMLSRILFASSCFNKGIRSLLSLQKATPGLFTLRILFRNLQLRERLQLLQPRERVVQIKEYLILPDCLNHLEDESQASKHLQSSKST